MKSMKHIVLAALALALVCATATVVIIKRQAASQVANAPLRAEVPRAQPQSKPSPPPASSPTALEPAPGAARVSEATSERLNTNSQPQIAAAGTKSSTRAKEPLKDPEAREALAWVGADPEAEAYWFGAINNPDLSAHERQDLIEDLNEDGLSDPKHPSRDDLPLIINRILLIEELGPSAMDEVNADAFAEAYKDLLNLADLAMGGGDPIR
jgi:hypothetical protein